MNKAYAHKIGNRIGDLYDTPKSLVWVAEEIIIKEFYGCDCILEPCTGHGAIAEELGKINLSPYGCRVIENDLYSQTKNNKITHYNYLLNDDLTNPDYGYVYNHIITNPPFSLWDEFVLKAKTHCKKFMFIGRLNYFGTNGRYRSEIWNNLKAIYPFNRYIDYQTPYRKDGLFHVGAMATAWFLWDMKYTEMWKGHVLDVQKYAKLGNFNNKLIKKVVT